MAAHASDPQINFELENFAYVFVGIGSQRMPKFMTSFIAALMVALNNASSGSPSSGITAIIFCTVRDSSFPTLQILRR